MTVSGDTVRGWITLAVTILSMIVTGGLGVAIWAFRMSMQPIKLLIAQNNTALANNNIAIQSISKTINDHEVRLSDVETTHHILGCDQPITQKGVKRNV